jgi:hypothetical protein
MQQKETLKMPSQNTLSGVSPEHLDLQVFCGQRAVMEWIFEHALSDFS